MLSLCMIVKNEEKSLKTCLSKVLTFVDEIIVVDTGSSDSTKKIAEGFTNKVFDFKWCNDFSKARNFSISKASSDWIIVIDADEYITDFNISNVYEFINNSSNKNKVGRIRRTNIMEGSGVNKNYIERINRIFNKNYFHYDGIIHEQVVSLNDKTYETEIIDMTVEHIGYMRDVLDRTEKLKRNIDLLDIALENNTEDPYLYFQLGKSYYMLKEYEKSSLYFEKALSFNLDFRLEYVEDLIETYGYSLINCGRYAVALALEKFLKIYFNSADYHFLMGLIYMNNANFTQAVNSFLYCTKFSNAKVEGITTYNSYYNIGVIYEVLGFKEEAIEYYNMCGGYILAEKRLKSLLS